jgi:hypothetical protein
VVVLVKFLTISLVKQSPAINSIRSAIPVRQCLEGLSYMLSSHKQPYYSILASRWYCARNSPGVANESRSELERFLDSLLGLLGFPSMTRLSFEAGDEEEEGVPTAGFELRKTGRGMQYDAVTRFEEAPKKACVAAHDGKVSHRSSNTVLAWRQDRSPSGTLVFLSVSI